MSPAPPQPPSSQKNPSYGLVSFVGLLLLMTSVLLAGCAAAKLERFGDREINDGNAISALTYYERALAHKPKLTDQPEFARKLFVARRDAAVQEGWGAMRVGRYDAAIGHFDASLDFDPAYAPAKEGKQSAQQAAAKMNYEEALADADHDDLSAARRSLHRALEYDPDHQHAKTALDSLDDPAASASPAAKSYREGIELADQKRWPAAADAFENAVDQDPDFLPARAHRTRSLNTLKRARQLKRRGIDLLNARQLGDAIRDLSESARTDPHDARTREALADARQRLDESNASLTRARQLLADKRWDEALGAVADARAIYPTHSQAIAVRQSILEAAADEYTRQARRALNDHKLRDADRLFARAMGYLPDYAPALRGRRDAAMLLGKQAEDAGRWGAALLRYRNANRWAPDGQTQHALVLATDRVEQRNALGIALASPPDQADTAGLEKRVRRLMRKASPGFVVIDPPPTARPAQMFKAQLATPKLEVTTRMTGAVARTHLYEVAEQVPNPQLPGLRQAVRDAARDVRDLEDQVDDARDHYRRAQRRADKTGEPDDLKEAQHLHRIVRRKKSKLEDAEARLKRARFDLSCAPPTITVVHEEAWPYRVETYRQAGVLTAKATLLQNGQRAGDPLVIEPTFIERDTTIDAPNPQIGLAPDPLTLTDPIEIRSGLLDEAAAKLSKQLLSDALHAASRQRQDEAADLHTRGLADQALEAQVDAAVVLGPVAPDAKRRMLDKLEP